MSSEYGTNHLVIINFKQILSQYVEYVEQLRRWIKFPNIPDDIYSTMSYTELENYIVEETAWRTEKIQHIKSKARAIIKEFMIRANLNVTLTVSETNGVIDIRGECPACHVEISFLEALTYESENNRLGTVCPNCNAKRWIYG